MSCPGIGIEIHYFQVSEIPKRLNEECGVGYAEKVGRQAGKVRHLPKTWKEVIG
jgi:hypothetical protein